MRGLETMKSETSKTDVNAKEHLPRVEGFFPPDIDEKFEFYNFGHALEILTQACIEEWNDLFDCFQSLHIPVADGWAMWGNQAVAGYEPTWNTYANHTVASA